jgi:hypothetical protein
MIREFLSALARDHAYIDTLLIGYVSDSMGHPHTTPDNYFTTKTPADLDKNSFLPSSRVIPVPSTDDNASKYFGLKLRCAYSIFFPGWRLKYLLLQFSLTLEERQEAHVKRPSDGHPIIRSSSE